MKKYLSFFFVVAFFLFVSGDKVIAAKVAPVTVPVVQVAGYSPSGIVPAGTNVTIQGNLVDLGGAPSVTTGFSYVSFLNNAPAPVYPDNSSPIITSTPMSKAGLFSAQIPNVQCGAMYVFKPFAINSAGNSFFTVKDGALMKFPTEPCRPSNNQPAIVSFVIAPSNITQNSATLNFNVDSMGGQSSFDLSLFVFPVINPTQANMVRINTPSSISKIGPSSIQATNLQCGTQYAYKYTGESTNKYIVSNIKYTAFLTSPCSPMAVSTVNATNITGSSATLNGNLVSKGQCGPANTPAAQNCPQEWYVKVGFDTSVGVIEAGPATTTGAFSATLTNLNCGMSYSFVARVDNGFAPRVYSQKIPFQTLPCGVNVSAVNVTNITTNSATLNATLASMGNAKSAKVGFSFSNDPKQKDVGTMSKTGSFSLDVKDLACGTQYAFKAFTDTGSFLPSSNGVTFSTLPCSSSFGNIPAAFLNQTIINPVSPSSMNPARLSATSTPVSSITVKLNPIVDPSTIQKQIDSSLRTTIDPTTAPAGTSTTVVPTIAPMGTSTPLGGLVLDAVTPEVSQIQIQPEVDNQLSMAINTNNPMIDNSPVSSSVQKTNQVATDANLSYGSTGEKVAQLQKILNEKGYLVNVKLGDFYGIATTKAVKKFQKDNGITQTGVVGPLTKALLNK